MEKKEYAMEEMKNKAKADRLKELIKMMGKELLSEFQQHEGEESKTIDKVMKSGVKPYGGVMEIEMEIDPKEEEEKEGVEIEQEDDKLEELKDKLRQMGMDDEQIEDFFDKKKQFMSGESPKSSKVSKLMSVEKKMVPMKSLDEIMLGKTSKKQKMKY